MRSPSCAWALLFTFLTFFVLVAMNSFQESESSMQQLVDQSNVRLSSSELGSVIHQYRPNLTVYEELYRDIHRNPELSGVESRTASVVASHLASLGYVVKTNVGGHGVVGLLENGPGKTVLIRAELDALPTREKTDLPYASTKTMIDRYGNERPVMHACGHDMNMAALLAASALLMAAKTQWSGTLITLFQPDEEETGGAQSMIDDHLYEKVPVPDVMLAQHVTPLRSGVVAIRTGPVLMAADAFNVRIFGGPCPGVNPQFCEDPIEIAMKLVLRLQNLVSEEIGPKKVATVACWGFHAGIAGADFVYFTDFLLDVKTWDPKVRERIIPFLKETIRAESIAMKSPKEPVIKTRVRAPLTSNAKSAVEPIRDLFVSYFASDAVEMQSTHATEDFSALSGSFDVPYAYWNFGGSRETGDSDAPSNHSPFYAPQINPTLRTGTDAMALAVLAFVG